MKNSNVFYIAIIVFVILGLFASCADPANGSYAEAPVIRAQPVSAIYFNGDTVADLTVTAYEPMDGGTLSYQWYSNTALSNSGGTAIADATSTAYQPSINTAATGRYFYYAVVTNTSAVADNPTAAASQAAEIKVTTPADKTANATFTVQYGGANQHQYVRGFGGMDVAWGNFPDYSVKDYENMFNPEKLGYNMLRIMILPNYTDIDRTMSELVNNRIYPNRDQRRFYENVKTVNRYGGYVLASPWSPPAAWKTNNSINGDNNDGAIGSLLESRYQDYADYLKAFARNMLNNGAPVYAVSIQSEPDYPAGHDGCVWNDVQMRDFFKQTGRFTDGVAGYGGGKNIPSVKTMNGESVKTISINQAAMNDAQARTVIDLLGRHRYDSYTDNGGDWIYDADDPREIWMTEHNINNANIMNYKDSEWNYIWRFMNDIDLSVRVNHEAAFIWWSAKRFYSMIGDGNYNNSVMDGEILPRGWGLAHYAKFAKESYRIGVGVSGATADGADLAEGSNVNGANYNIDSQTVKVSAFMKLKGGEAYPVNWRNKNVPIADIKEITMVMFTPTNPMGTGGYDMGTVKLQLPAGFRIAGAAAMRSNPAIFNRETTNRGTPEWETLEITSDRNAAFVELPVSTILSVRFTQFTTRSPVSATR